MPHDHYDHEHDHSHEGLSPSGHPYRADNDTDLSYWQTMEIALRELLIIYLHDLNIHNIMLDIENEAWLIDFDKCQIRQGSNWKNSNIARLKRSFEKEKRLHNIYWQLADWQILISAYNEAAMAN